MNRLPRSAGVLLMAGMLLFSGCKKKKPPVPPPQAQAPTITEPPAQPQPQPTTEPPATQPAENPPATEPNKPPVTTTKPKPKPSPNHTAAKPRPGTPPKNGTAPAQTPAQPTQTAKAEPPPDLGQISASGSDDIAQRKSTNQLIDGTEANLKTLNRTLSSDEQNTLAQIRNYIVQAKAALRDSDLERAHNLAVKANLLSAELIKH